MLAVSACHKGLALRHSGTGWALRGCTLHAVCTAQPEQAGQQRTSREAASEVLLLRSAPFMRGVMGAEVGARSCCPACCASRLGSLTVLPSSSDSEASA